VNRSRITIWLLIGVTVVALGRQIAYALVGDSLAARLAGSGGGPSVAWVAVAALAGSMLITVCGLGLLVCGVRERCALELAGWAQTAPRFRVGELVRRALLLSVGSIVCFTAFESTLHYQEGLGFHGMHCIAGPVHQNAAPVLVGLSLIAAALVTAADYLVTALRRAVARLLSPRLRQPRRSHRRPTPGTLMSRALPERANPSRGPPRITLALDR
jgi:hypothetical protein